MDASADLAALRARLEGALYAETGLRITIQLLESGSVPRSEGKAVWVIDRRPR